MSSLHQVFSRKRANSRWGLWCVVCFSYLTLLASPNSAGGGLGRARVVPPRRETTLAVFVSFLKYYTVRSNNVIVCSCFDLKYRFERIELLIVSVTLIWQDGIQELFGGCSMTFWPVCMILSMIFAIYSIYYAVLAFKFLSLRLRLHVSDREKPTSFVTGYCYCSSSSIVVRRTYVYTWYI